LIQDEGAAKAPRTPWQSAELDVEANSSKLRDPVHVQVAVKVHDQVKGKEVDDDEVAPLVENAVTVSGQRSTVPGHPAATPNKVFARVDSRHGGRNCDPFAS
jgi:hypothetical protein